MLEYSPNHLDHLIRSLYENKSCRTHRPMILTSKEEKGQLDHVPSFRNAVMVPSSPSWKLRIHQNCDAVLWSASSSLASLSRPLQSQAWIFPLPAATKKNWQQNLQSWRKPKSEIDIGWMVGWIRLLCFPVEHHNLELIPCHSLVAVNWLIHSSFPGTRLCESTSRMTDMFPKVRVPVCNCHIQPKEKELKVPANLKLEEPTDISSMMMTLSHELPNIPPVSPSLAQVLPYVHFGKKTLQPTLALRKSSWNHLWLLAAWNGLSPKLL